MKNSSMNSLKLRASSAKPKQNDTPLNTQKREKLKQLLIEKLNKKLNVSSGYRSVVEREVFSFIQMEKLNEEDLRLLESKIKKIILDMTTKEKLKNKLIDEKENESKNDEKLELSDISHKHNETDDNKSVYSNASQLSHQLSKFEGIKYAEITNFELRKLLQNEKKPLQKLNLESDMNDEWAALTKYKSQKLAEIENQNKILEKSKKLKQKELYEEQIKEKQNEKIQQDRSDKKYHRILLDNVDKLNDLEKKRKEEELVKSRLEKEIREKQIDEKIEKKLTEFTSTRNSDRNTIDIIKYRGELEKKKELEKQISSKQNLQRMLQDNEEFRIRQNEKVLCEREEEIKAMEDYKKILDKQERDRADYFKKCEGRQLQAMNRMEETVIKKENEKMRKEEEKVGRYQLEKDRRDQEEDERRINYIKDSKAKMKEFLLSQMNEKSELSKVDKNHDLVQADVWNRDNKNYFERKIEADEKIKNNTRVYAEFLKSQMKDKNKNTKMNEEEYRINRDVIGEMISKTPSVTKRNFLI